MEGTKPMNMEGTRPPTGASPTQPYKCGQNVKNQLVYLGVSQNRRTGRLGVVGANFVRPKTRAIARRATGDGRPYGRFGGLF